MSFKYSQILLIGGNARKAGKTSFIRNILKKFSDVHPITAMKVALYTDSKDLQSHYQLEEHEFYYEVEDIKGSDDNDSSRYVAAGAMEGWFVAAMDDEKSIKKLMKRIDFLLEAGRLLIIESNSIRKYIDPSLFLMINQSSREDKAGAEEFRQMSDLVIDTDSYQYNNIEKYIGIESNKWVFKIDN
ncbi:MAG: hypothetical protein R6U04_05780 [Bacteroidales bacterium]